MSINKWTLDGLITKVQNDLELHAENFVTRKELIRFANDAITDAEEIIVDLFSDYFLTQQNLQIALDQQVVPLPENIYECRIRGIYYDENEFQPSVTATHRWYKLKKIPLEDVATVYVQDEYQYRLINDNTNGEHIAIYPAAREASTNRFKLWYIREAERLVNDSDILDIPRPQFIISHMKVAVMSKEGDPMLQVELGELERQRKKLMDSMQRLSDDEEDAYMEPNEYSMWEAYGDGMGHYFGG